uniref:3-beta hydroxysteroid dehydrogenase/isomerase domain-containing protein n=1 Tax=Brassica oleracea var. oleracea TaxID=109376 RepID=A0A0D3DK14_BRAOL
KFSPVPPLSPLASTYYAAARSLSPHGELNFNSSLISAEKTMVTEVTETERWWCVVTGGRGFAARHLVEMLVRYQMFHVRIADLAPAVQLDAHEETGLLGEAMRSGRVQYVSADLRNKAQVIKAPDSSINSCQLHCSVNVQGTTNVIDACVEVGVKRLIYTSSPSLVFDGVNTTKAEGEALILNANGRNGLLTCSIRPSSIFGPGDRLLVPSLVAAARAGKSKFIIGDGSNLYDFTYVENVVHAHVCAERALASGGEVCAKAAGQAYFIANMESIKFWEFMSLLLEGLGYERPSIKIPAVVMMPIAHLVELAYKLLGPHGMKVTQLTPSRVRLLSCSRTFDSSKAKDLLGYAPVVPLQLMIPFNGRSRHSLQ